MRVPGRPGAAWRRVGFSGRAVQNENIADASWSRSPELFGVAERVQRGLIQNKVYGRACD